ncbi:hypothetical protein C8R45DRAFT_928882 [Mycena sanguinolenta]|nr:hypothetical protein C8R45DRAFT_928882 [Mycena sanguinolenta]
MTLPRTRIHQRYWRRHRKAKDSWDQRPQGSKASTIITADWHRSSTQAQVSVFREADKEQRNPQRVRRPGTGRAYELAVVKKLSHEAWPTSDLERLQANTRKQRLPPQRSPRTNPLTSAIALHFSAWYSLHAGILALPNHLRSSERYRHRDEDGSSQDAFVFFSVCASASKTTGNGISKAAAKERRCRPFHPQTPPFSRMSLSPSSNESPRKKKWPSAAEWSVPKLDLQRKLG